MEKIRLISCLLFIILVIPSVHALTVISTTTVLWDPIQYIGGEKVQAIYIADPTICPHMQADIIPNRIQMQRDFIKDADLFVAHNGSVDKEYVMPFVSRFMDANNYGTVAWVTLKNPAMTWNTPQGAKALSTEVAGWLIAADPENQSFYEARLIAYLAQIDAADLTHEERSLIAGQDVVVMVWQRDAAENWLGLSVVTIFGPEFYEGGKYTPVKIVDDIRNDTAKYRDVRYVIENMQSGELAKGIEEHLNTRAGIPAERVIFTNFPKSIPGVDTLPDVLRYNKGLVMPETSQPTTLPTPTRASLPGLLGVMGLIGGCLLFGMGRRR